MKISLAALLLFIQLFSFTQAPLLRHPVSTQSEEGFSPCKDTIKILHINQDYDIGVILPSWLPIVDRNYIAVLEGRVGASPQNGGHGPHVSHEDLPFFHYSHDVNFDVIPDVTEDGRYTNLLPLRVFKNAEGNDTILQEAIHVEWESGLGMNNKINPIRHLNEQGKGGGFFSAGHERGEKIWNWPSPMDWVHVEGHYVWDRGHPPSRAEIHPARLVAIKRQLPEQIMIGDSSLKFATRIDIFANGDGGALMNNRYDAPPFVKRVSMSAKDYSISTSIDLPRPSPNAVLRYIVTKHSGDNFSFQEKIQVVEDSSIIRIVIPWRSSNANDLEVFARTVYVFWDEGKGVAQSLPMDIYRVKFSDIHFRKLNDKLSKPEVRLFANVGNDWVFLNDFFPKKDKVLSKGLGKTRKKKWQAENEFVICLPRGKSFRVYMAGWEVDGIDLLMGDILDPSSPCDRKTKIFFKHRIFSIGRMVAKGCMDDQFGEITQLHSYDKLGKIDRFTNSPKEGENDDPCPFSKYPLKDRYFLSYTIEKLN